MVEQRLSELFAAFIYESYPNFEALKTGIGFNLSNFFLPRFISIVLSKIP